MEAAARSLLAKIAAARALLERAAAAGPADARDAATALGAELDAVELRFALGAGHLFVRAAAGEAGRAAAAAEFARVLAAEDFGGDVDRLVGRGAAALRAGGRAPPAARAGRRRPAADGLAELERLLAAYPRGGADAPAPAPAPDLGCCSACSAAGHMAVDAGRSELRCDACGALRELPGTVFEDCQFYAIEGMKAKSGVFNPQRHLYSTWLHLLAREPDEELGDPDDPDDAHGERLIARLRGYVARDRKILRLLTVEDVRGMLREAGRTALNRNVPLILKKLSGVGPPALSDTIAARCENLFSKAVEAGASITRADRINRAFYPYTISKVLDQLIPPDDYESRRIFYYTYQQGDETIAADDREWELICNLVPELTYKPTDLSLHSKYPPV